VGEIENGVITLVDDEVKFQNGFGAWARVRAFCEYDLRAAKVKNAWILER
jgi:hypothetical protein